MTARSRMTQRALVQRYTDGAPDDSGNPSPGAGWGTHLAAMPCWLYSSTEREPVTEETTAVVTDLKLLAPLTADVTEQDRIAQIVDRVGTVIDPGTLHIDAILRKRTHQQLVLSRVGG